MQLRWLSPQVFDWEASVDSAKQVDHSRFSRPHELLDHAEQRLASNHADLARADAILALKRAVNSRLKHIEDLYGMATAFPKSVGALERLEAVDLARPLLAKQMFDLRNDIEHNDGPVPNAIRCRELADASWYFLRATDAACSEMPTSIDFRPSPLPNATPTAEFVSLHQILPGLPALNITSRLRHGQLGSIPTAGHYEVRRSPAYGERMKEMLLRSGMSLSEVSEDQYGQPDDRIDYGDLVFDNAFRIAVWRRLFACHRLRSAALVHS